MRDPKDMREPDLGEIGQCLARSGYFMESRIITELTGAGFFVEASPSFRDPRTGKSRELDLIAEYFDFDSWDLHRGVSVKTNFVVEAVNNRFPFVLVTPNPYSPNANAEDYVKAVFSPSEGTPFLSAISDFLFTERSPADATLFCQFAELTRKNASSDLMASHGDGTYQSLLKLSEFVEDKVRLYEEAFSGDTDIWRVHFWRPMLVLGGALVTSSQRPGEEPELQYADFAQLLFNWHDEQRPRSTIIDIVTEAHLLDHVQPICRRDTEVAIELFELKPKEELAG